MCWWMLIFFSQKSMKVWLCGSMRTWFLGVLTSCLWMVLRFLRLGCHSSFSRFFQEDCNIAQPLTTIVPDSPSTEDKLQSCSIWLKFRGTCTGTKIKKSTGKIIPATWSLSNVKRKKQGRGVKNCCLNLSHNKPVTTICLRSCSLVISLHD